MERLVPTGEYDSSRFGRLLDQLHAINDVDNSGGKSFRLQHLFLDEQIFFVKVALPLFGHRRET